jgi:hypothetical protein
VSKNQSACQHTYVGDAIKCKEGGMKGMGNRLEGDENGWEIKRAWVVRGRQLGDGRKGGVCGT